jgi:3-methyl-2-oxobutanoate hydroxymethyltransferase
MRINPAIILAKKKNKEKISMLTAYDYSFASIVDEAGIDIILIGDSMANVIFGLDDTADISLDEMLNHSQAVARATQHALVVGDLPFSAYQTDISQAVPNARRFIQESGCQAVKIEWFEQAIAVTANLVKHDIPVMGHIGYTPQTVDHKSGSVVQGRDLQAAQRLLQQAQALETAGCFSIVLECIPWQLAKKLSEALTIPTIGIGAGPYCDGQVLVIYDMLGLFKRYRPKFVRQYANLYDSALTAVKQYIQDIRQGNFPHLEESFTLKEPDILDTLADWQKGEKKGK